MHQVCSQGVQQTLTCVHSHTCTNTTHLNHYTTPTVFSLKICHSKCSSPARNLFKCILKNVQFSNICNITLIIPQQEIPLNSSSQVGQNEDTSIPDCSLGRSPSVLFESPSSYSATACLSCSLAHSW